MYNYNPYLQNPYNIPQSYQTNNQNQSLIRVTGIDGAKAYQMPANSTQALFDASEDYMYIKSTDGAGFPTIRTFKFMEVQLHTAAVNEDYVSRKEFEEVKRYVEQFIQRSAENTNTAGDGNG